MSNTELQNQLTSLLTGRSPDSALKCLHYAARILTHRRLARRQVPCVPGVPGEPDDSERELAEGIVRVTEQAFKQPVEKWEESVASAVAEWLFTRASSLTTLTWGSYDRTRARRLLQYCRDQSYDSDWLTQPLLLRHDFAHKAYAEFALTDGDVELFRGRLRGESWEECAQKLSIDVPATQQRYVRALRKLIEAAAGE
jgi:hypothetical protein